MNYKYIVLDFGNVIVTPTSGDWNLTPKFLELIDIDKININILKESINKYNYILSEKLLTLDEEYEMFLRFYSSILKYIDYSNYSKIAEEIAYNRTYNNDKYRLCDNIVEELSELKEKYTLIMLSDNWPCVIPYMKDNNIYDYFDKLYVSSIYGVEKKDKVFFDYPISDYNIKLGEALFIDDNELNLKIAKEKGFDILLMDRYCNNNESEYTVINNLKKISIIKSR